VAVTHDINLACQYSDITLLLASDGGYDFGPVKQVLSAEKIESVFDVKTCAVEIGQRKFFFPLGKSLRDKSTRTLS
jgi:ABC-type cobalamin/Fe3+-siderophores transport system ATPase subunit